MEWVAVSVGIAKDPAVHRMAAALRVRVPEVVGLLTLTFAEMTTHAPDGQLGDVPDSLLEAWSGWHGKRGAFAALFRANLCDEDGLVLAWEKYNGAAIRRSQAARDRARAYRERQEQEKANGDSTHTQTGTGTHTRPVRERRTKQDKTGPAPVSAPHGAERQEPADDSGPALAGAALADVAAEAKSTGDYRRAPGTREALARTGYRPDPDAPAEPQTPLADQAAAIREHADRYRSLLETAASDWMAAFPAETKAIGAEQRSAMGLPRGHELTAWQTQTLRAQVVEAIRQREGWPTLELWDGETFGVAGAA